LGKFEKGSAAMSLSKYVDILLATFMTMLVGAVGIIIVSGLLVGAWAIFHHISFQ